MNRVVFCRMLATARIKSGMSVKQIASLIHSTPYRINELEKGGSDCGVERCMRYLEQTDYVMVLIKEERCHTIKSYKNLVSWINRRCWEGNYSKYAERLGVDYSTLKRILSRERGMLLSTLFQILDKLGYQIQFKRHGE